MSGRRRTVRLQFAVSTGRMSIEYRCPVAMRYLAQQIAAPA